MLRAVDEKRKPALIARLRGEGLIFLANDLEKREADVREEDGLLIADFHSFAVAIGDGAKAAEAAQGIDADILIVPQSMESMAALMPKWSVEKRRMMTLTPALFRKKERDPRIRVLRTKKDFLALFRLYRLVPGMEGGFQSSEDGANAEDFLSRPFPFTAVALFEDGRAVSGCYLSNAGGSNAMVSGVATLPGRRRRGYASSSVSEIVDISFSENGMGRLSLWYDDEAAAGVYRSLGFQDAGCWLLMRRKR